MKGADTGELSKVGRVSTELVSIFKRLLLHNPAKYNNLATNCNLQCLVRSWIKTSRGQEDI